jgi:predicted nucleotidyltransferase
MGEILSKEQILQTLKSNKKALSGFGVTSIGLFGSHAVGLQNNNSDIDIIVDFGSDKENYDNFMAVYDLIESWFQNQKIDLVTKNGLSKYIGESILKEAQYV